jgi:hypothetical protein
MDENATYQLVANPVVLFNENFAAYLATLPPNTTAPGPS